MNLAKAIEILQLPLNMRPPIESPDFDDALKLGIEAMKRVVELRTMEYADHHRLLPGETKD